MSNDVIVVGAGIAGLSAAKFLLQQAHAVSIIEHAMFGGLVINVNALDGAFEGPGAELAANMMVEVGELGCNTLSESVLEISRNGDDVIIVTDHGEHRAAAVLVASGARMKRLGIPGEAEFAYKGVSQCADCDGPMFAGQDVVVVGGGDSAAQEALVLAEIGAKVTVLHRGDDLVADPRRIRALVANRNVVLAPNSEVTSIEGGSVVEAIRAKTGNKERVIPCTGVFVFVGLAPVAQFLPAEVLRDAEGAVVTNGDFETGIRNIFAAGAVRAGYAGALSNAVDEARRAAGNISRRLLR